MRTRVRICGTEVLRRDSGSQSFRGELVQRPLTAETPPLWRPEEGVRSAAGCFICFQKGRTGPGDPGWAAAALITRRNAGGRNTGAWPGFSRLHFRPACTPRGSPARRGGPPPRATGGAARERHRARSSTPRRAGATPRGSVGNPSVGVTEKPLHAIGPCSVAELGATSLLRIAAELVGYSVRTKRGVRPLAIRAGWRTDPETGVSMSFDHRRVADTYTSSGGAPRHTGGARGEALCSSSCPASRSEAGTALCPFHDDNRPSLSIYKYLPLAAG